MTYCTSQLPDIEYRESTRLTNLGGFLMTYGSRFRVTMSTRLSPEEKERGTRYLLSCLTESNRGQPGVYFWNAATEQS